jgi:hypothetical protein
VGEELVCRTPDVEAGKEPGVSRESSEKCLAGGGGGPEGSVIASVGSDAWRINLGDLVDDPTSAVGGVRSTAACRRCHSLRTRSSRVKPAIRSNSHWVSRSISVKSSKPSVEEELDGSGMTSVLDVREMSERIDSYDGGGGRCESDVSDTVRGR